MSVTGVTAGGVLTDADDLEASVKAAMIEQAKRSVLLLDASKLSARGRRAVAPIGAVSLVLGDADAERPRGAGATVRVVPGTSW